MDHAGIWDFAGAIISALLILIVGAIRHQLNKRDEAQEKLIDDLYKKHEVDATRLQELELKIAENHYPKSEVDRLFDRFKDHFDERFDRLEKVLMKEGKST